MQTVDSRISFFSHTAETSELHVFKHRKDPQIFRLLYNNVATSASDVPMNAKISKFKMSEELREFPSKASTANGVDQPYHTFLDWQLEMENSRKNFEDKVCSISEVGCVENSKDCQDLCYQTGAKSARWFPDKSCCQCIGPSCFGYGRMMSSCDVCKKLENDVDEEKSFFDLE